MMKEKKIVVVDDEPFILRSLSYVLKREGYQVFSATNGEEAVQVIRDVKPELLFLDVMMPKKSGFEVCREIKSDPDLKDVYVVLLTARGQASDKVAGMELGADEFMTKPFSPSKIVGRVKEILETPSQ